MVRALSFCINIKVKFPRQNSVENVFMATFRENSFVLFEKGLGSLDSEVPAIRSSTVYKSLVKIYYQNVSDMLILALLSWKVFKDIYIMIEFM